MWYLINYWDKFEVSDPKTIFLVNMFKSIIKKSKINSFNLNLLISCYYKVNNALLGIMNLILKVELSVESVFLVFSGMSMSVELVFSVFLSMSMSVELVFSVFSSMSISWKLTLTPETHIFQSTSDWSLSKTMSIKEGIWLKPRAGKVGKRYFVYLHKSFKINDVSTFSALGYKF